MLATKQVFPCCISSDSLFVVEMCRSQISDLCNRLGRPNNYYIICRQTERIINSTQCWNCPILGGGLGFWILWSTCRRTKFANHNPARAQPRFKSWGVWIGRSPNRGREAPEIWGWSPNRGRSPRKSGGRGLGRGSVSPSRENFWNFELQIVQFGV